MQTEQLSPEDEALATELLQDMLVSPEQAAQEQHVLEQQQEELRQKLGQVLVKRRDEAIRFRAASGIERQWAEDQAYYEGEESTSKSSYYKGMTLDSPLLAKPKNSFKSNVFLNITRPYVETAACAKAASARTTPWP